MCTLWVFTCPVHTALRTCRLRPTVHMKLIFCVWCKVGVEPFSSLCGCPMCDLLYWKDCLSPLRFTGIFHKLGDRLHVEWILGLLFYHTGLFFCLCTNQYLVLGTVTLPLVLVSGGVSPPAFSSLQDCLI